MVGETSPGQSRQLPATLWTDSALQWTPDLCEEKSEDGAITRPPWLTEERYKLAATPDFPKEKTGPERQKTHFRDVQNKTATPIDACFDTAHFVSENKDKIWPRSIMPKCAAFGDGAPLPHQKSVAFRMFYTFYKDSGGQRRFLTLHPDDIAILGPLYLHDVGLAQQYCAFDRNGKSSYDNILLEGSVAVPFATAFAPDRVPLGDLFVGTISTKDGPQNVNMYDDLTTGLDNPIHLDQTGLKEETTDTEGKKQKRWRDVSDTPLSHSESILWHRGLKDAGVENPHEVFRPMAPEGTELAGQPFAMGADAKTDVTKGHRYWQLDVSKLSPEQSKKLRAYMEGIKNKVLNVFDSHDRKNGEPHVLARTAHFITIISHFQTGANGAAVDQVDDPSRLSETMEGKERTDFEKVMQTIDTTVKTVVPNAQTQSTKGKLSLFVIGCVKFLLGDAGFELQRAGGNGLHVPQSLVIPHQLPPQIPEEQYIDEIPDGMEKDDAEAYGKMKHLAAERLAHEVTISRINRVLNALVMVGLKLTDVVDIPRQGPMNNKHKVQIDKAIEELIRERQEIMQKVQVAQGRIDQLSLTYRGETMQREFQAVNQVAMESQKNQTWIFIGVGVLGTAVSSGFGVWQMKRSERMHRESLAAMNQANAALQKDLKPEADKLIDKNAPKGEMRIEILESYKETIFTLMGVVERGTNGLLDAIQGGGKSVFETALRHLQLAVVDTPEAEFQKLVDGMSRELAAAAHQMRSMRVEFLPLLQDVIDGAAGIKGGRERAWAVIKAEYARIAAEGKTPILLATEFSRLIKDLTNTSPHEADRANVIRGLFDALALPLNEGGIRMVGELTIEQKIEAKSILIKTGNGDLLRRFKEFTLNNLTSAELLDSFFAGRKRLGEPEERERVVEGQWTTETVEVEKDGKKVKEKRKVPVTEKYLVYPQVEFGDAASTPQQAEANARAVIKLLLDAGMQRREWKQSDGANYDIDAAGKYIPNEGAPSAIDKLMRGIIDWRRTELLSTLSDPQLATLTTAGHLTPAEVQQLKAGGNPHGRILPRVGETSDEFSTRKAAILSLVAARITPADVQAYLAIPKNQLTIVADRVPTYEGDLPKTSQPTAAAGSPSADFFTGLIDASAMGIAKPEVNVRNLAAGIADRIEREMIAQGRPKTALVPDPFLQELFTRVAGQVPMQASRVAEFQQQVMENLRARGRVK